MQKSKQKIENKIIRENPVFKTGTSAIFLPPFSFPKNTQ
jgi:hypothetical protein